ncbi:uncharacterized protein LOC128395277 [Panonychus citri]|uniref:uncharacterized protein LOC128395277 n=1 Tax=Panonychus citri TaxID=50023 RepID=UPI0023082DDB|nr:uncharacterized protein LOC128395277 [Panonychus citri]
MSVERAKIILTETLFSKSSNGPNDLISLTGGRPLIADSLIYRLTFDPEEDDYCYDDDDDEKQLFTINNNLKSSIDVNDNDVDMINVWSSNWDNNNQHDDHENNGHDKMKINEPEFKKLIFNSRQTINKLNVSSLADEIIDSEMNSLKCLQFKPTNETIKPTTIISDYSETIETDHHYNGKSTGQCPSTGRKWKSSILPSLMRGTINTETSIITRSCPPTRACLSCCTIS